MAAILLLSVPVLADVVEWSAGPGLEIDIPNLEYPSETLGFEGMVGHVISVAEPMNGTINDLNVTIGMSHHWVGDVTIKLLAPDGTTLTLLNRPGHPESHFGHSADFSFDYPILYDDEAPSGFSAEEMGDGCDLIGPGVGPCGNNFLPAPMGLEGTALRDFDGKVLNGDWTIYLGDSAGGQTIGTLDQWKLTIDYTPVPAPYTIGLLISALVLKRRVRRSS